MTLPWRRRVHVRWNDDNGPQRLHIDTRREGASLRELAALRVGEKAVGPIRDIVVNAAPPTNLQIIPTAYRLRGVVCKYDIEPEPDGGFGLYRDGAFLGAYPDRSGAETQMQLERWKDEVK